MIIKNWKVISIVILIGGITAFFASTYLYTPFSLTFVNSNSNPFSEIRTYYDLDGDGIDEQIHSNGTTEGVIGVSIFSATKPVWQENFYGELANGPMFGFSNLDGDDYKEVILCYVRNDSAFVGGVEFTSNERIIGEIFISKIKVLGEVKQDFTANIYVADLDNDGFDELIFSLFSGYGIYPRIVAVYYHKGKKMYATPDSWEAIWTNVKAQDLNNDGEIEIILAGNAPGNSDDSNREMNDRSARVIVLDRFLKKYEGGFEMPCAGCGTITFNNQNQLHFRYVGNNDDDYVTQFYKLKFDGKRVNHELIREYEGIIGVTTDTLPSIATTVHNRVVNRKSIGILNSDFSIEKIDAPPIDFTPIPAMNTEQGYFYGSENQKLWIMNDEYYVQSIDLPTNSYFIGSIVAHHQKDQKFISINYNNISETYLLEEYAFWWQRFGFTLASIFIIGLITAFVGLILNNRFKTKQQKLISLRIRALRNQLEPHFALNLMSSIKLHLLKNDVLAAEELFDLYTKILKYTLSGAEEIGAKLSDELKYVSTYLEIEQKQSDQLKSFHIEIDPELADFEVPKMLIQEHVENALKHGIRKLEDQSGHLEISARKMKGMVEISIADNGIGRVDGYKDSGKGIALTYELLEIFNTLTKQKVVQQITDLPKGTKVTITAKL